jgi:hypothetical protein
MEMVTNHGHHERILIKVRCERALVISLTCCYDMSRLLKSPHRSTSKDLYSMAMLQKDLT